MVKVISFSLWGDDPKYTVGAVRNAQLSRLIYPGWECWFYHGTSVPSETLGELDSYQHVKLINIQSDGNWTCMFDRFRPASDKNVDVMISRDCDSRLSLREKFAVDAWLDGTFNFHIMRDHPWHATKILGGMWGAKRGAVPDMEKMINEWEQLNQWQTDQDFLAKTVYPHVWNKSLIHDSFGFFPYEDARGFPVKRDGLEFVGSVFNENEETVAEHAKVLSQFV